MYTSTNPDRPYAGKALSRMIEQRDVKPACRIRPVLDACGFAFVSHDFGDELWRHRDTGETLRLKYINRDAWQVEREPVEEPKKARKRARVYVMDYRYNGTLVFATLHEMSETQFETLAAEVAERNGAIETRRVEIVPAYRAHKHVMDGRQHTTALWVDTDAYGTRRIRRAYSPE